MYEIKLSPLQENPPFDSTGSSLLRICWDFIQPKSLPLLHPPAPPSSIDLRTNQAFIPTQVSVVRPYKKKKKKKISCVIIICTTMQIFKAAVLLVSSIGFKVALGCEPGYDSGCIDKLAFGNNYSRVGKSLSAHQIVVPYNIYQC
jgi:hypothetical protein